MSWRETCEMIEKMPSSWRSSRALALGFALSAAVLAAACDDQADALGNRRRPVGSSSGGDDGGVGGPGGPGAVEKSAFEKVEPNLQKNCGKTCHDTGQFVGAPAFLAGPDVYASIKAHPGIVTRDVFASSLLTKGPHAGPSLASLPELEAEVITWLEIEAVAIQSQRLPSTPAFTVVAGDNVVDLTPAGVGVSNVHLKFKAELLGTSLSLSQIRVSAPAGQDIHILQPKFVRVLGTPLEDGTTDIEDPADSFSNSDQTIPGGQEDPLAPGAVIFSNEKWRPFDLAADKLRVEMTKLEPGKVSVVVGAAECADPGAFGANVVPTLRQTRGGGGGGNTCQGCHGNGLAGLSLNDNDNVALCKQVLAKLNKADLANSLMVTKVAPGGNHNGGAVADIAAWRALFVNNAAVFFKP
ncbi:MAG: hypothetical protein KIT84_30905 [Labilithrix sp.]|nr:hypothetical protein [Labilithrix sp.]MCW5815478.1 hypothetical protein [Labilithrix sp.]